MSAIDGLEVVRHPRARRAKLSVDPVSGRVRLTISKRASEQRALAWAAGHGDWIAAQRARLPEGRPFVDGAALPFGDETLTIRHVAGTSRTVRRDGDTLIVAGPVETIGRRIEAWLRREALRVLSAETADCAVKAGVAVSGVAVGDARGRWGSCASTGSIRYSWRLILAPSAVRRATVAHEVAHRVHMNHSPAFHALVAALYGRDPTPERQWLRTHGAALHWFGRGSSAGTCSRGA